MRLEKEIQGWISGLAGKSYNYKESEIYSVIRYDDDSLSQEMRKSVEGSCELASSRHRSVFEACRVLKSLVEPRFYSANTNISAIPGNIQKPDLVLQDEISGAFIIVELKRSQKAAREFATELLAYTNCLLNQYQGSQVFLVLVSTSWATLEQSAFAELAQRDIPVLPLEYREESEGENIQTLWVRSDLLPVTSVEPFPAHALQIETKVFWLPARWFYSRYIEGWMNRIQYALEDLLREAERGHSSGFLIVWNFPHERADHSHNRWGEVRVFVSMAVRNPYCTPSLLKPQQESDAIPCESDDIPFESCDLPELSDDTALRLLLKLDLGERVRPYSSEYEGTWEQLYARLQDEQANILRFDGFGEIGDQVSRWRTQKRYVLSPMVRDISMICAWHPLTWLPALEALIESDEEQKGFAPEWRAFRCGKVFGKFMRLRLARLGWHNFEWAVAQTRFFSMWCEFFAKHQDAPKYLVEVSSSGCRFYRDGHLCEMFRFATYLIAKEGELASLCFSLGYHLESGFGNEEYLLSKRRELRESGINLPQFLDAEIDKFWVM